MHGAKNVVKFWVKVPRKLPIQIYAQSFSIAAVKKLFFFLK